MRAAFAYCLGFDLTSGEITPGAGSPGAAIEVRKPPHHAISPTGRTRRRSSEEPTLIRQLERLFEFYEPICKARYDNAPVRLRDLDQLVAIASRYRSRSRFITDLTLDPPQSTSDLAGPPHLDEDYLVLSTIHSAKGCEWDVVHILHAADGMIPSDMSTGDEAGIDEERRLFYVAMTRAKDMLYVYYPLRYYHRRFAHGDAHTFAQLTRFLSPQIRVLFAEQTRLLDVAEDDASNVGLPAKTNPYSRVSRLWDE
jgi:DNA helicase-2/ATP-dependent DNA helicase PcrA